MATRRPSQPAELTIRFSRRFLRSLSDKELVVVGRMSHWVVRFRSSRLRTGIRDAGGATLGHSGITRLAKRLLAVAKPTKPRTELR